MLFGRTTRNRPSRFVNEIPQSLIERIDESRPFGFSRPVEKPKSVPAPEIKGTVGVHKPAQPAEISYTVGDLVMHRVFGKGRVLSMTRMSNDMLVEVAFESKGVKKIMANFARLQKL